MGALQSLNNSLLQSHLKWADMTEEEQDSFLAEWVLDGYENGDGRNMAGPYLLFKKFFHVFV